MRDETLGQDADPQRIACDGVGRLYVTQPRAGLVQQFSPEGKLIRKIPLPRARAICRWVRDGHEQLAIVASNREVVPGKGWTWLAGEQIDAVDPETGNLAEPIQLPRKLEDVADMAADGAGNVYLLGRREPGLQDQPEGRIAQSHRRGEPAPATRTAASRSTPWRSTLGRTSTR